MVEEGISRVGINTIMSEFESDLVIHKLTSIPKTAKDAATPEGRLIKGIMKILTPAAVEALKQKKEDAHWKWKCEEKPKNLDSAVFQSMKATKKYLTLLVKRLEVS